VEQAASVRGGEEREARSVRANVHERLERLVTTAPELMEKKQQQTATRLDGGQEASIRSCTAPPVGTIPRHMKTPQFGRVGVQQVEERMTQPSGRPDLPYLLTERPIPKGEATERAVHRVTLPPITSALESLPRLRRLVGIDKAVFYSILSRASSAVGSLITIPLILTRLTSVEQGFYYTFGSILALQVVLEMGFGTVAIQMVAHEAAHLRIDLTSGISGPTSYLDRFSATIRFIRRWYLVLSLLVGMLLFPTGFWFFATSARGSTAAWLGPWAIMVVAAAGIMFVNSLASIIEGMGFVADSIRVRLWGGATQILVTVVALLTGCRLYSAPVASVVALVINFTLVWRLLRNVIRETSRYGKGIRIGWLKEVFPFQWRIALSWVSGWLIFSAMLPVVFRQLGPEEAGRFGLAMSVSGFIGTLALNWTSTKSAPWGHMASRGEWKSMDSLFWRVTLQSVSVAALTAAAAILFVPHLPDWIPRFSGRVPERRVLLALCSVAVMNQMVFAEAFYLRAHKREPFLANSVVGGIAMAFGLFGFSHSSAFSVAEMYAILTLFGLIWASSTFFHCRESWHRADRVSDDLRWSGH
jgi:hypothetical protein